MIKWLLKRHHVRQAEIESLRWYRIHAHEYEHWLCEFPDIALVIRNLRAASEYEGSPKGVGGMDISPLREEVRRIRSQS